MTASVRLTSECGGAGHEARKDRKVLKLVPERPTKHSLEL